MSRHGDCKLYVGDLSNSANKADLEDAFSYYGPLRSVWLARNPPGFAFVEFEDARDAEDAMRGLDGRTICGRRARVEMSVGSRRRGPAPRRSTRSFDDRCYDCGDRGHFARDCKRKKRSRSRSRRRSPRSRSRSRSRSASRSRSRSRSKSRARSRSRSKSRPHTKSRSRSRSRSRSKESKKSN